GEGGEGARVRLPRALPPGGDPRQLQYALRAGGCPAAVPLGDALSRPLDSQERPCARHGRAVGAGVPGARSGQRPRNSGGKGSRVQGDAAVLRGRMTDMQRTHRPLFAVSAAALLMVVAILENTVAPWAPFYVA